jgi:hypothetical protein
VVPTVHRDPGSWRGYADIEPAVEILIFRPEMGVF